MNRFCGACERPLAAEEDYPGCHPLSEVQMAPEGREEPEGPEELGEAEELAPDAAAPISYHLTEAANKVAALEARCHELVLLAHRADNRLAEFQRHAASFSVRYPRSVVALIEDARLLLTRAQEII